MSSCPYVARRTVDLAPAVLLAMQLLMAALFGILGVLFADPILATLKVVLVDLSQQQAAEEGEGPEVVAGGAATAAVPVCCCWHLLRLHLLHHRRAAADDLPHPDLEGQVAVLAGSPAAAGRCRRPGSAAW